MSPTQPQSPRPVERTNDRLHTLALARAQDTSTRISPLQDQLVGHSSRDRMPGQDPLAYCKAFLHTRSLPPSRPHDADQLGDGGTWCQSGAEARLALGYAEQQNKHRVVPHGFTIRAVNQSNGAPLATIVEQRSVSTLDSYGSLLSVARFPSLRAVKDASPGPTSHRLTRSLDDATFSRKKEGQDKHTSFDDADVKITPKRRRDGKSKTYHVDATTARPLSLNDQHSRHSEPYELNLAARPKGLKGLIRGVLTLVRGNMRSRLHSYSSTDATIPDQWSDISPSARTDSKAPTKADIQEPLTASQFPSLSRPTHDVPEPQPTTGPKHKHTKPSVKNYAPKPYDLISTLRVETAPAEPKLPFLPDLSHLQLGREAFPSAHFAPQKSGDAALDHVRHADGTDLIRSREKLATRYTSDGSLAQCNDGDPLDEMTRNASQNASFCSTISTSYSGTVLGVDLDVQHEFPHATRRSVTPVWFSPKKSNKDQNPPKRVLQYEGDRLLHPHSITSCALTSLLPIAAAEGIAQQSLTTPQLTFYPPSGNLIQSRSLSPTPTSTSSSRSCSRLRSRSQSKLYFSNTTPITTSHNDGANSSSARAALSEVVTIPPARSAIVPLTALSPSIASLPEHLRHHHNYHRVDTSCIGSACGSETILPSQVVMTSDSQVPGCGGVLRPPNLDPRSGVPQCPPERRAAGRTTPCLHIRETNRLAAKTSSLRASNFPLIGSAHTQARTSRKKGKTLQKRRLPRVKIEPRQDVIGPAAGHAFRICFCQPYDGAGSGAASTPLQERRDGSHASPAGPCESTPNARIVTGDSVRCKGRTRRDSAVSLGAAMR